MVVRHSLHSEDPVIQRVCVKLELGNGGGESVFNMVCYSPQVFHIYVGLSDSSLSALFVWAIRGAEGDVSVRDSGSAWEIECPWRKGAIFPLLDLMISGCFGSGSCFVPGGERDPEADEFRDAVPIVWVKSGAKLPPVSVNFLLRW